MGVLKEGDGILRDGSDEIREGIHLKGRPITTSKGWFMRGIFANLQIGVLVASFPTVLTAQVPPDVRASIDRILGAKGTYIPASNVYKVVLPRAEATIVWDYQTLSPNLGLNSWVAFKSGMHDQAILSGQLLLLDDEVDPGHQYCA